MFAALDFLKDLPNPILVDCSGRHGAQQNCIYERCLELGISVVLSSSMSICGLSESVLPMTASARLFGHSTVSYTRSLGIKAVNSSTGGGENVAPRLPKAHTYFLILL